MVALGLYLVWHRNGGRDTASREEAAEETKTAAPSKDEQPGRVHLTAEELQISGIQTRPVQIIQGHEEIEVLGAVLAVQDLLDLTTAFQAALFQEQRAAATESASRLEYQRLFQLNLEDKNASDKAVQAAEATFRTDSATLRNTQQVLKLARATNNQHWGSIISGWMESNSPTLEEVLSGRRVLIQVTFPDSAAATPTILIAVGDTRIEATFLSPMSRVDARFQKPTFLYQAPASSDLEPGTNVSAFAAQSRAVDGVLVTSSSVLHWQGKTWVYWGESPGVFDRKEVVLDTPVRDGWLVKHTFQPNSRVVTTGAQQLLSQEFRTQPQTGGDDN